MEIKTDYHFPNNLIKTILTSNDECTNYKFE